MTYAQPQADPTSVMGRRIFAYILDSLLVGLLAIAIIYPMFMAASVTVPSQGRSCTTGSSFDETSAERTINSSLCFEVGNEIRYIPEDDTSSFTLKAYGTGFGLGLLDLVVLQGLTGASVGKLILGLRVIRNDGRKAGIGWAALRWVLLLVDGACCAIIGLILAFTTKGHRRLGDMAAGTLVVRSSSMGTPPHVPGVTTAATWPGAQPGYGPGYQPQGQSWPAGPAGQAGPAAPGWSPPAQGSGTWAPQPGATDPGSPAAAPASDGPTWDQARNAYIQYDQDQGAWVQWSDATKAWGPIDQ